RLAVRPRDVRRAREGARGRRRAARHSDARRLALAQRGDGRRHGGGRSDAANRGPHGRRELTPSQSIRQRGRDSSEPEPKKYETGEGHLTPLGATPHPHRSLALSLPTACQVPTQAEADIAPPTSPTPAGFPETMAKKSFAWNFPRPKQWQKKAWLKFSS